MNRTDNNNLACNDFEFINREIWARIHKNKIIDKIKNVQDDPDIKSVVEYMSKKGISVFPYEFTADYKIDDIVVRKDKDNKLFYTITKNNHKIYLKKKYKTAFRARRYISNIYMEQDINSPHKYITNGFEPEAGSIIIDIGGAEGFFALDYIDIIKHVYIFECDPDWIEALEYTYKEYEDKITIIKKMVTDYTDDTHICLNDFIKEHNLYDDNLYIKIDAESSEIKILDGANDALKKLLRCHIFVCSYHKQDDELNIRKRLEGWTIQPSTGYMLYYYDYDFKEPYVRHGVLRCRNYNL